MPRSPMLALYPCSPNPGAGQRYLVTLRAAQPAVDLGVEDLLHRHALLIAPEIEVDSRLQRRPRRLFYPRPAEHPRRRIGKDLPHPVNNRIPCPERHVVDGDHRRVLHLFFMTLCHRPQPVQAVELH